MAFLYGCPDATPVKSPVWFISDAAPTQYRRDTDVKPTDEITAQYDAYPYPERDPADESKRLITGSPSWPEEMDHWLWGGARDWTIPLRALVAGGGTGDGLIQLAQRMTSAGRPFELTYLDLSTTARGIAQSRAQTRGLKNITFVTESLLKAAEFGEFDYIDCCGVLHHLPNPQDGFDALAAALAPGGGIGLMVYAPHGRAGVYPLQSAFNTLGKGLTPKEKIAIAKIVFAQVPDGHPFKRNPHLVDHKASDAGFYDLLVHSQDRPFTITELAEALDRSGLKIAGTPSPQAYDPIPLIGDQTAILDGQSVLEKMQLSENLRGTLKTHVVYATRAKDVKKPPLGHPDAIPHLRRIDPRKLAQAVAKKGSIRITEYGAALNASVPKSAARLISGIDGRRSLGMLRDAAKMDPFAFNAAWTPVENLLTAHGLLHYSNFLTGV